MTLRIQKEDAGTTIARLVRRAEAAEHERDALMERVQELEGYLQKIVDLSFPLGKYRVQDAVNLADLALGNGIQGLNGQRSGGAK